LIAAWRDFVIFWNAKGGMRENRPCPLFKAIQVFYGGDFTLMSLIIQLVIFLIAVLFFYLAIRIAIIWASRPEKKKLGRPFGGMWRTAKIYQDMQDEIKKNEEIETNLPLIEKIKGPFCCLCGNPQNTSRKCKSCEKNDWQHIDQIRLVIKHNSQVQDIIYSMKKRIEPVYFEKIMTLANDRLRIAGWQFSHVCYVPSDKETFNLSLAISEHVTATRGDCDLVIISKIRETRKQKQMKSVQGRKTNVFGAFKVESVLTGQNVLICDDFSTSGATFDEIARVLKEAGAGQVFGLALTRRLWEEK